MSLTSEHLMGRRLPDAKSLQCQMVTVAIGGDKSLLRMLRSGIPKVKNGYRGLKNLRADTSAGALTSCFDRNFAANSCCVITC